jgi:thiol-disulfide isomerase/thioredoxin
MRSLTPRPILLALTLLLIVGAIAFVELRFNTSAPDNTQAAADPPPAEQASEPVNEPSQTVEDQPTAERIASKEAEFPRAKEISDPTGFINTDGVLIGDSLGKKVILLDFWAYSCANCKNTQPYLNAWNEKYEDDGLLIIGVHKPEFEFEKDPASVRKAVEKANIRYPVVLDNNDATWNAYDQHYWPAWYLIDADGFIQYKHFGEGAYDETEQKIQDLLAEKDQA